MSQFRCSVRGLLCCCSAVVARWLSLNTLRPRQNGRHFADDTFKHIFVKENVWILIEISLKFVPEGPINNIPALVQIMAWCRPGDKPLSEPMMVCLPTHICVTRPQWVNSLGGGWGCEVSCGGHHRQRGKTNTGSALDGAVLYFTQILAYLVHNMSKSNYIWGLAILADSLLFFSVKNILAGSWLNCISSVEITLFLTNYCSIGPCFSVRISRVSLVIADSLCKLIQSLFLQWFINLMGALTFLLFFFIIIFFLEVNCGL